MAKGILNLDGTTIFRSNNGIIEIPPETFIKGISDSFDVYISAASFDNVTKTLTLETNSGNTFHVNLNTLSTGIVRTASEDATALAIALG